MASVQERMIGEKVEAKKEMLHIHNSFANRNADLFREKGVLLTRYIIHMRYMCPLGDTEKV